MIKTGSQLRSRNLIRYLIYFNGEVKYIMNKNVEMVNQMKEYIDAHICEPIIASDIAKATGYSQYHAARIFKKETGQSPFEYIREQRMIRAAYALRRSKKLVIDVALDFVFDSHEGFTRAFSKAFGISPRKFSNYENPEGWHIPYYILHHNKNMLEEKNMSEKTSVIFTQIIERPARKLILKRGKTAEEYFAYCKEVDCGNEGMSAPWDILCGIKESLYEPVGLWLPNNMIPEGTGIYAHGIEVAIDYSGEIPDGFDIIDLPPCKFIVFQGEPYDDENFGEHVDACMERIEKFNPEVYGYQYEPTLAPRMQLAPMGWRGYIEMRPVITIN